MKSKGILLAMLIGITACTGASEEVAESTVASTATTPAPATTVAEPNEMVAHPIDDAVAHLLDAGSYAFEASIFLNAGNEVVETELEGWVDGEDRELVVKSGDQSLLTKVVDGVATVERDGEVSEVPLQEATEAPSLTILSGIDGLVESGTDEYQATLKSEALRASGFDDTTPVTITLKLDSEGNLSGYQLQSADGLWSANVRFEDIGESFSA